MNNVLITSDLHLTSRPIDEYRWEVFPWLRKRAKLVGAEVLVLAGDVTDKKDKHDSRLVNRLVEEIRLCRKAGLVVVWLIGNHDYLDPSEPFFGFLQTLQTEGVHFITEPTLLSPDLPILLLPHTRNPLRDWRKLDGKFRKAKLTIIHQTVKGAVTSNGETMKDGLAAAYFLKKTKGPVVSGDIHVPQRIGCVHYCGAPYPVHSGDSFSPRVLLFSKGKLTSIPRTTIRKISATIGSPEEITKLDLQKGDQVVLQVRIDRADFYRWQEIKKSIRIRVRKAGAILNGCSLKKIEAPTRVRLATPGDVAASSTDPSRVLRRYSSALRIDLGGEIGRIAESLLADQSQTLVQGRARPGDIEFRELTVQGFRSYGDEQTLTFPKRIGTYLLSGYNRRHPRLAGNGAGKSSLFDALCWVLFGKTARGTKGPGVVNWSGDYLCSVSVTFTKAGKTYKLTRTQAPNSLVLEDPHAEKKSETQEGIHLLLGITWESFLFMVLMGQFNQFFFDLSDTKKLEVFSSALELHVYERAAKDALKRAGDEEQRQSSSETRLRGLSGRITALREGLRDLKKQRDRFEDIRGKNHKAELERLHGVEKERKSAVADLKRLKEAIRKIETKRLKFGTKIDALVAEIEEDGKKAKEVGATLGRLKREDLELQRFATFLSQGDCSHCRQKIAADHRAVELARISKERKTLGSKITACEKAAHVLEHTIETLTERLNALSGRSSSLDDRTEALQDQAEEKEREVVRWKTAAVMAKDDAAKILATTNPHLQGIRKTVKKIREAKADRARTKKQFKLRAKKIDALRFWTKGFKDLRLWLIREAQTELEIEVNNALIPLGLDGWRVEFDIEKENKTGGGVQRGFQVFIRAPGSPDRVAWEAWSGGETQRLRIAGAVGMAALLQSRSGIKVDLEGWDEPTTHLVEEGIADLVAFLEHRAQSEGKKLWIIDPHSLPAGGFQGEIRVVRGRKGSILKKIPRSEGE